MVSLVVAALMAIGAVLAPPLAPPARACNGDPDFNPVTEADVIVAGRITGWELGLPRPVEPPPENLADVPVQVTIAVTHVVKGSAPDRLVFYDSGGRFAAELAAVRYPNLSVGIGGCSAFDADPTGLSVVMGLHRGEGRDYRASRLLLFFEGDALAGVRYQDALARLAALGPVTLPRTGAGNAADDGAGRWAALLAVIAAGAVIGLRLGRAGSRRETGGRGEEPWTR